MKVFNQPITFQNCLNQVGVDPRLSNVSQFALGVLGTGTALVSCFFTAKQTALFALASAGLIWVGLRAYSQFLPPNYEMLEKYSITEEGIKGFIKDAKDKNFEYFEFFLKQMVFFNPPNLMVI